MSKRKERKKPAQQKPVQRFTRRLRRFTRGPGLLAIAVVVAVAAVGVLIVLSMTTQGGGGIKRLEGISAEGRSRGEANAPVTIIEFGDYQCPNCKHFEETAGSQIEETYIATGKARLEFRNMAFIGDESIIAAAASLCANEQNAFWPYHDKLFAEQRGENSGAFSFDNLKGFAGDLGLDQTAFDACLDSTRTQQVVLDETRAGTEAGVDSTPTFFINGQKVTGAKSFSEFENVIEQKLAEAAATP
jgi:protein-disulfide isomerase